MTNKDKRPSDFDDLIRKILEICPDAEFSDQHGEIVVSTGWKAIGGPNTPLVPVE